MAERKSILLRLRPELHDALQQWAQEEFRSVNGQLEFVLARALRQAGRAPKRPRGTAGADAPDESGGEGGAPAP